MQETIGLLMMNPDLFTTPEPGGTVTGLGFAPVTQLPNGKLEVWSVEQLKQSLELGFRAVAVVKTDVTRHGTKITHSSAYSCHHREGTSQEIRALVELLTPATIDLLLDNFYSRFNATKDEVRSR